MKSIRKIFQTKKALVPTILASALLIGPFAGAEFTAKKIDSVSGLNEGASTCFTRVGQTFTALMIGNFNSDYLAKDFISSTGECYAQLNSGFDALYGASFMDGKKPLNKLTSDLFWFHEKGQNLAKKAVAGETELSLNSNIVDKYSALEGLSFELQERLTESKASLQNQKNILSFVAFLGALALGIVSLVSGQRRASEKEEINRLEIEAMNLLDKKEDLDALVLKSGRIMERLFNSLGLRHSFELYGKVQNDLIEAGSNYGQRSYQEAAPSVEAANEVAKKPIKEKETSNINLAARNTADRLSNEIEKSGVMVDEFLEEDFWVEANNEGLEQLLFNLYSFAIESSAKANGQKKAIFKSKALGGISYFKTRVSNCLLNAEEMEVFNGSTNSNCSNVNLLLLKEIATDMGCSITAKNIINGGSGFTGCEVEVVFTRAKEAKSSQTKNARVLKGTKKEILAGLRSEA